MSPKDGLLAATVLWSVIMQIQGEVVEVSKSKYDSILERKPFFFLMVTSKADCKECDLVYPKFLTASQPFAGENEIVFGKTKDKAVVKELGVNEFPSFFYFEFDSTKPQQYRGDATVNGFIDKLAEAMRGDFKTLRKQYTFNLRDFDKAELMGTSGQYKFIIVYDDDSAEELDTFEDVSERYRSEDKVIFGRVDALKEKKLAISMSGGDIPAILFFAEAKSKKIKYEGEFTVNDIASWVTKKTGLQRGPEGNLGEEAGWIPKLDDIVQANNVAIYKAKKLGPVVKEMERSVQRLDNNKELAEYYLEVLKQVESAKTPDILDGLRTDLLSRLSSGNLSQKRLDFLLMKRNIVQKFINEIGRAIMIESGMIDESQTLDLKDIEGAEIKDGDIKIKKTQAPKKKAGKDEKETKKEKKKSEKKAKKEEKKEDKKDKDTDKTEKLTKLENKEDKKDKETDKTEKLTKLENKEDKKDKETDKTEKLTKLETDKDVKEEKAVKAETGDKTDKGKKESEDKKSKTDKEKKSVDKKDAKEKKEKVKVEKADKDVPGREDL